MKWLLGIVFLFISSPSFGAITRVNTLHQYVALTATPYSLGTVTAGNLIVCGVSSIGASYALSDTVNGSGFTHLTQLLFQSGGDSIDLFYILSSAAGADSITLTYAGFNDTGLSCAEIHTSAGTWSFDNSIKFDGSSIAGTASPRTGNFTTTGADDYWWMFFADEANTWSGNCATFPCPTGSFSNIQWDNGHVDGQAEWKDATAQTNLSSGWDATSSAVSSWGIYLAAFTASGGAATAPNNVRRVITAE